MAVYFSIFLTIFLAELGDKSQLAAVLLASDDDRSRIMVFAAASTALIAATGLSVLLGAAVERHFGELPLKLLAGLGFIAIGVVMVVDNFSAA